MATKSSILIFYLRIMKDTQRYLRIASYIILTIVNVDGIVLTFLNVFQCRPVYSAWDSSNGSCISIVTLFLASAPVNVFTDLAILCLPLPVLTSMRLPQRQKNILIFTFGLGIFATIVDIVRIYYLQQASAASTSFRRSHVELENASDFYWNASLALMWSAVEVNVGMICACIPTLKPLIMRILPAIITDRVSNTLASRKSSGAQVSLQNEKVRTHEDESPNNHDQPAAAPSTTRDVDNEIDMMDFLTVPDMDPGIARRRLARPPSAEDTVYFGFVNFKKPRSMLNTRGRESFVYCAMVTILFFLWGFSYGLLNSLNTKIADLKRMSPPQRIALSSAYFGGYLCGPLTVGQYVLRHYGFKVTIITGLGIYGTGSLIFWPSAVLLSFPGFFISNFVVAFGLSLLETAANPFLILCGPNTHAEFRILLAQGIQAVASVVSETLAEKALFVKVSSLIDVQWTYLAIALFDTILALFFYYTPLPEASDEALQTQTDLLNPITVDDRLHVSLFWNRKLTFTVPIVLTTIVLAIFSQYNTVAAQECMSVFFIPLLRRQKDGFASLVMSPTGFLLVAHGLFAISRFLAAGLCLVVRPRIILLISFILTLLMACLVTALPSSTSANAISVPALLFYFSEAPLFPLIFALGLRGLGKHTKMGAAALTAAVGGGCGWPFVMRATHTNNHLSFQRSFVVVVVLVFTGSVFPIWLNFSGRRTKGGVDPVREELGTDEQRRGISICSAMTRDDINATVNRSSLAPTRSRQVQKPAQDRPTLSDGDREQQSNLGSDSVPP